MAKTRIEHIATGAPQSVIVFFDIDEPSQFYPFGYLHRDHIFVYDSDQVEIPFTWDTPTGNTITVEHTIAEAFYVQRKVPRDELYVEWEDGAVLHDRNIAAAHLQHLMLVQEIDDGFVFGIEDPDNSLLPVLFRGIRVPDEVAPIRIESLLTPDVASRANTFFAWDALGDIWAIPIGDLLDLIGGSTAQPGRGLVGESVGELTLFNVDNPQDSELYAIKDDLWVRVEAKDVIFNAESATNPGLTVQAAIAINTILIAALTAGTTLRGVWDATLNDPNLLTGPVFTGDYWWVEVAGPIELPSHPNAATFPAPLGTWLRGERALYIDDADGVGWFKFGVVDSLPADNILVDNLEVPDLESTSQLAHEARAQEIDVIQAFTFTAGDGLDGGGTIGTAVDYSVIFAGTGVAVTVARSDHNHDTSYDNYNGFTLQGTGANGSLIASGDTVNIVGAGATVVAKSGNTITVTSTDTNTEYDLPDAAQGVKGGAQMWLSGPEGDKTLNIVSSDP